MVLVEDRRGGLGVPGTGTICCEAGASTLNSAAGGVTRVDTLSFGAGGSGSVGAGQAVAHL
jgi:hypothetical protein